MKILNALSSAITNDSITEAEQALGDYIDPLLRAVKSCYLFEDNEGVKEILINTIRQYEPNFMK
jgi:hypothetical protein